MFPLPSLYKEVPLGHMVLETLGKHFLPHRPASRVPTAPENERPAALFLEFPFQSRWPRPPGLCFSGALQSWGARRAEAGGDGAHGEGLFRNAGPSALLKPCQCLLEDHGVLHTLAWSLLLAPLLPEASLPLLRRGGGGVGVQEEEATPLQPQQGRAGQACRPLSRPLGFRKDFPGM